MSKSEFDWQQVMLLIWVSLVEDGEQDGEASELLVKFGPSFDCKLHELDICIDEESDNKLFE